VKKCVCTIICVMGLLTCGCGAEISAKQQDAPGEVENNKEDGGGIVLEEKEKLNDGIHLTDEAKKYGRLEQEIDILLDELP